MNAFVFQYTNMAGNLIALGVDDVRSFKYIEDAQGVGANSGNDVPLLRYADILLSRAEALNELNGPNEESIGLINRVREVAGASSVNLSDFSSKELLRDFILAENTVVIFTSDNGELLGGEKNRVTDNAPLRSGKGYPFEGGIRVPTIIRWPGVIEKGTISEVPIISMDYFPTMLDIVGLDLKKFRFDGASLLGVLKSDKMVERDLFWHFPHYRQDDVDPYTIVRSGPYKLIYYYDNTPSELYHLIEDVSEANNLAEKEPDLVKELEIKIDIWVIETNAKTPKVVNTFSPNSKPDTGN